MNTIAYFLHYFIFHVCFALFAAPAFGLMALLPKASAQSPLQNHAANVLFFGAVFWIAIPATVLARKAAHSTTYDFVPFHRAFLDALNDGRVLASQIPVIGAFVAPKRLPTEAGPTQPH